MYFKMNRREALKAGAALTAGTLALGSAASAVAADKPVLRFAAVFSDKDIRADMIRMLVKEVAGDFTIEPHYGGTLFKQGTELVALQRNNLEIGNVAPQDISKQLPAWSLLTAGYLFRDPHHLATFFASSVGDEMKKMAEDKLRVKILGPTFFGTRQVTLRITKRINTPEDMHGVKLRMPGGEAWQFLGKALGANPVPLAYAEVYTALQTGAIDGQDNPFPNVQNMKFYEVSKQIVLTSHLVAFDLLTMNLKTWNSMSSAQQQRFQAAVDKVLAWSTKEHLKREAELGDFFREQGLTIHTPDVAAFRKYAQNMYLHSDLAKDWPQGMLEKINAL